MQAADPPDVVLRRLLADNGVAFKSLRPARGGMEHHLFHVHLDDGQVRYAKVPREAYRDPHWPDRTPQRSLEIEAAAVALVADKCRDSVAVATPYQLLQGDPPGAMMGVVPGAPPELTVLKGAVDLRLLQRICSEMGSVLAELHRVRRPADPGPIPDLPGADLTDARLLHMDFHLGNVLGNMKLGFGWKCTGVVDWTCAHWGPREADVAEMGASLFATNPSLLDDFLIGYRTRTGVALRRHLVLDTLVAELERRLRDDPPGEPRIHNLWIARVEEWSRQI